MTHRAARRHTIRLALAVLLAAGQGADAQSSTPAARPAMSQTASGSFDVKMTPRAPADGATPGPVGIMALDKQFHGDLQAHSVGEMVASHFGDGAATYVALEVATGTLHGRRGSFALAHMGTMTKAGQELTLIIAPGSGTGELAGISGTMTIRIEGKAHYYEMRYELK